MQYNSKHAKIRMRDNLYARISCDIQEQNNFTIVHVQVLSVSFEIEDIFMA